jgi:hypothetical protein
MIVTLIKGFKVDENPFFILIESILNLVIIGDFLCRLKVKGLTRFFGAQAGPGRLWNWLDFLVVLGSLIFFLIVVFSHATTEREE